MGAILEGFNDFKEIIEGAIGEVTGGRVNTSRGHLSLDKEEGLNIRIKPKNKNDSRTFEGLVKDERPLGMTDEQSRIRCFDNTDDLVEGYTDELDYEEREISESENDVKSTHKNVSKKKKNTSNKKKVSIHE